MTRTVATTKPVEIQVISSSVAPTAPRMWVRATLTMLASMAPIKVPKLTETVTSHLLTGSRSSAATAGKGRARVDITRAPR
jgi:hypothetical protein